MSKDVLERRNGPGQDPPLADWFIALSHDSPFEGRQSATVGSETPPSLAAVPSLLSLLQDDSRAVRLRAVTALGDFAGAVRRVLPALRAAVERVALHDDDDAVRTAAVHTLLRAGPQPATEIGALVDALRSEVDVVRFHAAIALGDFGGDGRPAMSALIAASHWDVEPAVRIGAAMALWKIDGDRPLVLYVLTEALGDANELICWVAAECLGQIGPAAQEAVPALRQAMRRDFRLALVKTGVRFALERIDPRGVEMAGEFAPPA
jgi:HEAT repeat protein